MEGSEHKKEEKKQEVLSVNFKGYQGFGSFHSENVEDLIRLSDEEYKPPAALSRVPMTSLPQEVPPFGTAVRKFWYLDEEWTFINHGAFGAACVPALKCAQAWQEYAERQPLRFIDRELFPLVVHSIRSMAAHIHCDARSLCFMPNATSGLNTVLQSLPLKPGDAILSLDIGYGGVKKMIAHACERSGASHVTVTIPLPLQSEDEVVAAVQQSLNDSVRLCVFDHITSNSALVLPIKKLISICQAAGALVLIDGAHGLNSVSVDIEDLHPDFYVTNCHKWFAAPRGTALMYVKPDHRAMIRPLIVSHGYGSGFTSEFIWDGCRDYSGILAIPATLKFWQWLGVSAAQKYCQGLLQQVIERLHKAWGTEGICPPSMHSHMGLVGVPVAAVKGLIRSAGGTAVEEPFDSSHAKALQDHLHFNRRIEVPIKCFNGKLYIRVSCMVYNCMEDYERLQAAVDELIPAASSKDGQVGASGTKEANTAV